MFGITAAAPKNITQKNHRNFFTKVKSKSIIHFVASIGVKSQLQNFSLNSDDFHIHYHLHLSMKNKFPLFNKFCQLTTKTKVRDKQNAVFITNHHEEEEDDDSIVTKAKNKRFFWKFRRSNLIYYAQKKPP